MKREKHIIIVPVVIVILKNDKERNKMTKELTRLIMKYTCSDETKTEEAESLTSKEDAFQDNDCNYQQYITIMKGVKR